MRSLGCVIQLLAVLLLIYLGLHLAGSSAVDDAIARTWAQVRAVVESR